MRPLRSLLIVATLTGVLVGAAWFVRGRWVSALTEQWHERLAAAAPAEATELLTRAARAGMPGMELAVGALDSPHARVAEAAQQVLLRELDAALERGDALAAAWQTDLAATLAQQSGAFGQDARRRAAGLALRMLTSLERLPGGDRAQLVAHCEAVLGLAGEAAPSAKGFASHNQVGSGVASSIKEPAKATTSRSLPPALIDAASPSELAVLPGGGEVFPFVPCPTQPANDTQSRPSSESEAVPPRPLGPTSDVAKPDRTQAKSSRPNADEAAALKPMSLTVPVEAEPDAGAIAPSDEDLLKVIRRLRTDPAAAETDLTHRGFGPVELALARRLIDKNPEARRELARMLPQMNSVIPQPWLAWLCKDEDADVRLTAASLLATCGDPSTLAEVEHLAAADSDPRLKRLAEQIAERRKPSVIPRR